MKAPNGGASDLLTDLVGLRHVTALDDSVADSSIHAVST